MNCREKRFIVRTIGRIIGRARSSHPAPISPAIAPSTGPQMIAVRHATGSLVTYRTFSRVTTRGAPTRTRGAAEHAGQGSGGVLITVERPGTGTTGSTTTSGT